MFLFTFLNVKSFCMILFWKLCRDDPDPIFSKKKKKRMRPEKIVTDYLSEYLSVINIFTKSIWTSETFLPHFLFTIFIMEENSMATI